MPTRLFEPFKLAGLPKLLTALASADCFLTPCSERDTRYSTQGMQKHPILNSGHTVHCTSAWPRHWCKTFNNTINPRQRLLTTAGLLHIPSTHIDSGPHHQMVSCSSGLLSSSLPLANQGPNHITTSPLSFDHIGWYLVQRPFTSYTTAGLACAVILARHDSAATATGSHHHHAQGCPAFQPTRPAASPSRQQYSPQVALFLSRGSLQPGQHPYTTTWRHQ